MLRNLAAGPCLPGRTLLVVDVSGSMGAAVLLPAVPIPALMPPVRWPSWPLRWQKTLSSTPRQAVTLSADTKPRSSRHAGDSPCVAVSRMQHARSTEVAFSPANASITSAAFWPAQLHRGRFGAYPELNCQGGWAVEASSWSGHFLVYIAAMEELAAV